MSLNSSQINLCPLPGLLSQGLCQSSQQVFLISNMLHSLWSFPNTCLPIILANVTPAVGYPRGYQTRGRDHTTLILFCHLPECGGRQMAPTPSLQFSPKAPSRWYHLAQWQAQVRSWIHGGHGCYCFHVPVMLWLFWIPVASHVLK